MDIDERYRSLIRNATLPAIKATWVEQYVRSPITFWCDLHAPEQLKDPDDPFLEHLFAVGDEHQVNVTVNSYPGAVEERFFSEEEGFRRTLELMAAGEKFIKNMPLLCRSWGLEGRPDVLVRVDDIESDLGTYSYGVVEIKSARHITTAHTLQGAVYNRLLGIAQGYEPKEYYIINRDSELRTIDVADVSEELDAALEAIRNIINGDLSVEPCHGTALWPWQTYVNSLAIQNNDVSLLPDVGPVRRQNLSEFGFRTVDDVAGADEPSLVQVKGVGAPTANSILSSAKSIQQGIPIRRNPTPEIPRGKTEVFFDLEGADPGIGGEGLQVVNYLIGVLVRRASDQATFEPFFAPTFEEEERVLRGFFDWAVKQDDPMFYHWHHYERTHLTKMAEYYGLPDGPVSWVLDRMVDLSPLTTNSFAFPCYGRSLKDIARCLGFQWRQDDVTALTSVVLYLRYVRLGEAADESRQKILDYNEDDCLATMHVFDWLLAQE